jgi:hypothetical protein
MFKEAARGPWRVWDPTVNREREISWTKGQPLGLGPSFFVFTFSHYGTLLQLSNKHGGDFVVLGDDVAIVGDDLYKAYRDTLATLECPVAEHKCLHSKHIGEFAGKIIHPDWVLPQLKFRAVSDRNFLDVARLLGPRSLGIYPKRQRQVLQLLAEGPEDVGGLNWNPRGIPENLRRKAFEPIRKRLQGELNNESWTTDLTEYENQKRVFQFALQVGVTTDVPHNKPLIDKIRLPEKGPSYLRNTKDTPLQGGDPRGSTTLEVVERKLHDLLPRKRKRSDPIKASKPSQGRKGPGPSR